jgi:hypothetical protein
MSRDIEFPLGFVFQITFSPDCISPKTPEAVTSSVTKPITAAHVPDVWLAALAVAD